MLRESDTLFKVYCPGQYKIYPHKLKMYNNGSVSKNIRYQDICNIDNFVINIAYQNEPWMFKISNNTMVEWYDYMGLTGDYTYIPYDYEILSKFFQNNNIVDVNWINSYEYGGFNDDTGNWTGIVGQVNNYCEHKHIEKFRINFLD